MNLKVALINPILFLGMLFRSIDHKLFYGWRGSSVSTKSRLSCTHICVVVPNHLAKLCACCLALKEAV